MFCEQSKTRAESTQKHGHNYKSSIRFSAAEGLKGDNECDRKMIVLVRIGKDTFIVNRILLAKRL